MSLALLLPLLCSTEPLPAPLPPQSGGGFEEVLEPAMDSVYMLGVARRSDSGPETFQFVGTGWVIAEGKLATNAHVAESLLEGTVQGRMVARRSWSDRDELSLSARSVVLHPAYGPWNARLKRTVVRAEHDPLEARSLSFIPVADIATIDVEAGLTGPPLRLFDPALSQPALAEQVVYLGFPSEGISGFPTLHAVPGAVAAKTDFFFQRAPWADCYLIHYCGPVVGGASGSPIFNRAGEVIGLISAAEHNTGGEGERTSFGFAYGQRVDLARELLAEDYPERQRVRDRAWCRRMGELLMPPAELLESLALSTARADGLENLSATNLVLRRTSELTATGLAVPVTMEPGLKYLFLAASHDGTDVDARLTLRNQPDEVLVSDLALDYFPVVSAGPFDDRQQVDLSITAAEPLLAETSCTLYIYKYEPILLDVDDFGGGDGSFFREEYLTDGSGERPSFRFELGGAGVVTFSATSADSYDIDLVLSRDGVEVGADRLADSYPVVSYYAEGSGTLELTLIVPPGAYPGSAIRLSGFASEELPIAYLADRPASGAELTDAQLFERLEAAYTAAVAELGYRYEVRERLRTDVEGRLRLERTVPAGATVLLVALAPGEEDLDLRVFEGDTVLGEDVQTDNIPVVFLEPHGSPRQLSIDLFHGLGWTIGSVGFELVILESN
jgi:hypothetical protein